MCVCMHACVRACVHVCVHACVHACVCACMCACVCVCMHACMCACVHVCVHACVHACVLARCKKGVQQGNVHLPEVCAMTSCQRQSCGKKPQVRTPGREGGTNNNRGGLGK